MPKKSSSYDENIPPAPLRTRFGLVHLAWFEDDENYAEEIRHRFETDHFFAAELLGFRDFIPELHQPSVDLHFPKNKNLKIADQDPIKLRMWLEPRSTFKSSLGKVDCAQWIAAFPELITILYESATQPLAAALSKSVSAFFWQRPGSAPTAVHLLYPHVVDSREPDAMWNTPCHETAEMDSTLNFTSPKTTQAGWHPWVICPDDMVDGINSGLRTKAETRRNVIDTYFVNKNLLRLGGYMNIRGTRYHPEDLYGNLLNTALKNPDSWKILVRGSLTVKSGEPLVPEVFPPEDQVILHFPQILPYKLLREKFYDNYESFLSQQQNSPGGGAILVFGERLYQASLIEPERIPQTGETLACWRLTYGGKDSMAKYAEGVAARINNGRLYILDAWQVQLQPSALAAKIVRELKRFETGILCMEALPGTAYMEAHVKNEALRQNASLRVQWYDFEEDDHIRSARLRQLEPQMQAGRISISSGLSKSSEIRRQFVHFGLVEENGIVDCISRIAARVPLSMLRQEISDEEIELQRRRREDAQFNRIFGQQGIVALEERARQARMATLYAMNRTNQIGLPDLYGLDC